MAQPTHGPAGLSRYLLPREVQVAAVRQHPAVLIWPATLTLLGLLLIAVLTATYLHGLIATILWAGFGLLLLRFVWKAASWWVYYFVVTSQRLLLSTGLLTRKVNMMPLSKVTDMSFQRSFSGRLLGYGEFIVESAGQDQALRRVRFIPYPEQLYLLICGMIFPESADDEDDESPAEAYSDEL
jgi:uncharacterized membrane protein YdbT with pleckstrin-like domain